MTDPVTLTLAAPIAAKGGVAGKAMEFVTDNLSLIMQWYGMNKQIEENRRIEKIQERHRIEDIGMAEKWREKQWGLTQRQQRLSEEATKYGREWQEEQRRYTRAWDFTNRLNTAMNQNINFRRSFMNLQRV